MSNNISHIVSKRLSDGTLLETVFCPIFKISKLAIWKEGKIELVEKFKDENGSIYVSDKSIKNLKNDGIILFPSKPQYFDNNLSLLDDISLYLDKYLQLSHVFKTIVTHFILLTWIYDEFNQLPYLRKIGDLGTGKTRFLQTIGSICYKPVFASGGASTASLFHLIEKIRGTLIIDEADFTFSDEKAAISKILNNGNVTGFPIIRLRKMNNGCYAPVSYSVFCPKIVASRGRYQDNALESRFITEYSSFKTIRSAIPISLPKQFHEDALHLRNKLLVYRFRNIGKHYDCELADEAIDPRIKQTFSSLLSIIEDDEIKNEVLQLAEEYSEELKTDRTFTLEADILSIINKMISENRELSVGGITKEFIKEYRNEYDRRITSKWIGYVIRKRLYLKTYKTNVGYIISPEQKKWMLELIKRYCC